MAENHYTFDVQTARDLRNKLEWEQEQHDSTDSRLLKSYIALNFGTTAWHLCEWVWREIRHRYDLHSMIAAGLGVHVRQVNLETFRQYVRQECPAIARCRLIGTAGKHTGTDLTGTDIPFDAMVSAHATTIPSTVTDEELAVLMNPLNFRGTTKLFLDDDEIKMSDVMEQVVAWWTKFIYGNKVDRNFDC